MGFVWDKWKSRSNWTKHKVSFETAQRVKAGVGNLYTLVKIASRQKIS